MDRGVGRAGDAPLGIARHDLARAMPVRRMVDDPVDRQRHILHQPVHAALSLVVIIGSILSILPLQRRSALPRLHRSSSVTVSAFSSEEHTSELQSLMRISYAVFCLKKKT